MLMKMVWVVDVHQNYAEVYHLVQGLARLFSIPKTTFCGRTSLWASSSPSFQSSHHLTHYLVHLLFPFSLPWPYAQAGYSLLYDVPPALPP